MAIICAIHCLATPILLVGLPILATTVWVDANFHLWMILLVIPTTTLAVWSGCRRHRDRWVVGMAVVGLGLLSAAVTSERIAQAAAQNDVTSGAKLPAATDAPPVQETSASACSTCSACALSSQVGAGILSTGATPVGLPWHLILNVAGGLCLATAHTRNFLLCRKGRCEHPHQSEGCQP
nr:MULTISPECIES: MerC domain-containing protein [unclassified Lentimonas]